MSDSGSLRMKVNLTRKEQRVVDAIKAEGGPISIGYLGDYAGIPYRGVATICRNLERKGVVCYGGWWDEEHGHDIHLTEEGALLATSGSENTDG